MIRKFLLASAVVAGIAYGGQASADARDERPQIGWVHHVTLIDAQTIELQVKYRCWHHEAVFDDSWLVNINQYDAGEPSVPAASYGSSSGPSTWAVRVDPPTCDGHWHRTTLAAGWSDGRSTRTAVPGADVLVLVSLESSTPDGFGAIAAFNETVRLRG